MPTTYTDQFFLIDPYAPPASGTLLLVQTFDLVDFDDDGDFSGPGGDTVDGSDVTGVYNGDTVTVQLPGGGVITITGATLYLADGREVFTPTDATILEDATFLSSTWVSGSTQLDATDLPPACFAPGTLIETADGPRPIEELEEGDLVRTRDAGLQPILWISRRVEQCRPDALPVRICKGALGNDRDLIVSPQHRMLISGWRAEMVFGADEVFAAARHLRNGDTIHDLPCEEITYLHLLLPDHGVIYAEGIPTESFDPGGELARSDPEIRSALAARFPGMMRRDIPPPPTARPVARGFEAAVLLH